ncbi:hypothetical protein LJR175_000993 [Variovorax sp. LjRoot175]|uniref:hypothetical protein n=1 Tax=Variovorax sp. LjRoot175 TaxID=3342276 RepID=UPI003ECE1089
MSNWRIAAALGAVLAAGCASPTGIVPIGSGTYMSSKMGGPLVYSGSKLKAELYAEASVFCAKTGKQVEPLTSSAVDAIALNNASAEIQFRCV